jgi:hypothetical protein
MARSIASALRIAVPLLALGWVAGASTTQTESVVVALGASSPRRVAVELVHPAEYVAVQLVLRGNGGDAAERLAAIAAAKAKLTAVVAQHPGWRLCDGQTLIWTSDSSSFSSSSSTAMDAAGLSVLAPLPAEGNLYSEAATLTGALLDLRKESSLSLDVRSVELALADPEQYRPQLLKLIAEDAARTRDALAPGSELTLSGLASPVRARKLDDRTLALFLDYRIELRSASPKH